MLHDPRVDLGELQPGERLLLADGAEGVVESVQPEYTLPRGGGTLGTPTNDNGLFSVYNFRVLEWHTYHVAASVDRPFVFVHNAACPLPNRYPGQLGTELAEAKSVGAGPLKLSGKGVNELLNQGAVKFVVTEEGELLIGPHTQGGIEISHAVLSGGRPILAAGEADIAAVGGERFGIRLTNKSGHFRLGPYTLPFAEAKFHEHGITFKEVTVYVP